MSDEPGFSGVYIFARDLSETVVICRCLGLQVQEASTDFARVEMGYGRSIEFGTAAITRSYDLEWHEPSGPGTNTLRFGLASREAVDAKYAELTNAGYHGHLSPIDAIWGERFALVDDPNGNIIAIHSPQDPERRIPPP